MTVTATFDPSFGGTLTVSSNGAGDAVSVTDDAAGRIEVDGGAIPIQGGVPTTANTRVIGMIGNGGNDALSLGDVGGSLEASIMDGGTGNDTLVGGSVLDFMDGGLDNDLILGRGGADILLGGGGSDTLAGGDGDDLIVGEGGNDKMFGGNGNDTVGHGFGDGDDLIEGGDGVDKLIVQGSAGADAILVSAAADRVRVEDIRTSFRLDIGTTEVIEVNGDSGNDLVLTAGNLASLIRLVIDGGDGNDILFGGNGDDVIKGSSGSDTIAGGSGNDRMIWRSGDGNDVLDGGGGVDTVDIGGGSGVDAFAISTVGGHIRVDGTAPAAFSLDIDSTENLGVNAGDGNDRVSVVGDVASLIRLTIDGGDGIDTAEVNGGNGSEVFSITADGTRVRFDRLDPAPSSLDIGTTENVVVNMGGGDDKISATGNLAALISLTVDGGAGNDTISGGNGVDLLQGGDGNDSIDGNQGNYFALLGAGNDIFQWDPGDGNDIVEGQAGIDTLLFNGADVSEVMNISANGARARLTRDVANVVMDLNDIETIQLKTLGGVDNVTVNDLSGTDIKLAAIDLAGTLGGATGDGAADTVKVNATNGNDSMTLALSGTAVLVNGLAAQTAVDHADAGDRLVVDALIGNDVIDASKLPATALRLALFGGEGNDTVTASAGADELSGGAGNDALSSLSNSDTLDGGLGADTMQGGFGADVYIVDDVGDRVIEVDSGGRDLVRSTVSFTLGTNVDNLTLLGGDDLTGIGNGGRNVMTGNDGDNLLDGKAAADNLAGGKGNDTYVVDNDRDVVTEAADSGIDTVRSSVSYALSANVENLVLTGSGKISGTGNGLDNLLTGNGGSNVLDGGDGADTLIGGGGNDTLTGGEGGDRFAFSLAASAGADVIADFDRVADRLSFSDLLDVGAPGLDLDDLNAAISGVTDGGVGGNVTVAFANGARLVFEGLGTGAVDSIDDLVADPATQIIL